MANHFLDVKRQLDTIQKRLDGDAQKSPAPVERHQVGNQAINPHHMNVADGSADDLLSSDGSGAFQWVAADGTTLEVSGTTLQMKAGGVGPTHYADNYILLRDVKSNGSNGGDFNSGAWRTRTLNEETSDGGGHCTLAANQFTLAAGTYIIRASAPAAICNYHKLRLQNITAGTTITLGGNAWAGTSAPVTHSFLSGRFTVAASQALELQHYCSTTRATDGMGVAVSFSVSEIYAVVELQKVG
jgi:hypothetical protein